MLTLFKFSILLDVNSPVLNHGFEVGEYQLVILLIVLLLLLLGLGDLSEVKWAFNSRFFLAAIGPRME